MIHTVTATDPKSRARTGVLRLPHGDVPTPAFMPVGTNGTVKAMYPEDLDEMGVRLILGNTYHLYLRPGTGVIAAAGGLHAFANWRHNILTDSGGFQVFSLSGLRRIRTEGVEFRSHIDGSTHFFTPEKVIDIQSLLGSDVCMPLDLCTEPGISREDAREAMETTLRWLIRSREQWRSKAGLWKGSLFGIVQGNFFHDLRRESAERTLELGLDGVAIGGLSVGEPFDLFREYLSATAAHLPESVPRYLMGIGSPDYIFEAVENGIDMFDCVLPTRTARNGQVFTRNGTLNLKKSFNETDQRPIDEECRCPACASYSRSYLRHLFKAREILGIMLATRHNLEFLRDLMQNIRGSIANGSFVELKRSYLETYTGLDPQRGFGKRHQ